MTNDLTRQVAAALDGPCGCEDGYLIEAPLSLAHCPICLPKRVAVAIEAATSTKRWPDENLVAALAALRGEKAQ